MPSDAYSTGLALLARRELSAAQVAERLRQRGFEPDVTEAAVHRLREERVLDDRRTATMHARRAAGTFDRGPQRAEQEIVALGIDRTVAGAAVIEVYAEQDTRAVLERSLARRLPEGAPISDRKHLGKLYRYLVRQGFDPQMATAALRARMGNPVSGEDEPGR